MRLYPVRRLAGPDPKLPKHLGQPAYCQRGEVHWYCVAKVSQRFAPVWGGRLPRAWLSGAVTVRRWKGEESPNLMWASKASSPPPREGDQLSKQQTADLCGKAHGPSHRSA